MAYRTSLGKSNAAILRGETDLASWDDEELIRGRRRDKHGGFTGRPPRLVPVELHEELLKRKIQSAERVFATNLVEWADQLNVIITDERIEPRLRFEALRYGLDRVLGRPSENARISATVEHRDPALDRIVQIVSEWYPDGVPAETLEVLEAQVVDEDEEEE